MVQSTALSKPPSLIPFSRAICFTLNAVGIVLSVDWKGATYLGYKPEELLNQSIVNVFHPIDRTRLHTELATILERIEWTPWGDFCLLKSDGSQVRMEIIAQRLQAIENQTVILLHCEELGKFQPSNLMSQSQDWLTALATVSETLHQQAERERLMIAIAQDVRRSLNLKQVLNTTVAEVRDFLQTDRVLILQFNAKGSATVLVESVGLDWQPILGHVFEDSCFVQEAVDLGSPRAIADIHAAKLSPSYVERLLSYQVRAVLVVPILQRGQIWGLLIAHHCAAPRQWQPFETNLLTQLAAQVSIAIQQSELYRQVQRLNADLERQVQKHTAELQLAFEFEATLKRITDRVRDSLDEEQILQTAVQELATATGVATCNAALYDVDQRISQVRYEHTTSLVRFQGRVLQMDNFVEGYCQLLQGQYFQFCSLMPIPQRGQVVLLACPILDDQGVLGDLWLVTQAYHAFNEQDIRLVQQVANQCAIALRQARLYQKAQAQVEELEKLNQLKDDFLSTVSHELRTPMANIKLATQMLEIGLQQSNLLETQVNPLMKYFQILHAECQREIHLINDLLDLSRLEVDSEVVAVAPLSLDTWLPPLLEGFAERARSQHQNLRVHIPANFPQITTDLSRLERILSELLNNACKYTPLGGEITLMATAQRNQIVFQVSNTGVEISPSELTRIFDKFYRIPNNDPWKYGGTGLGLALVKRLVETLGGVIQVTSYAGLTQFTVELPQFPIASKPGTLHEC